MMVTSCASRTCACEMLCHNDLNGRCHHLFSRSVSRLYEWASLPVNGQPYLVAGLCSCVDERRLFSGVPTRVVCELPVSHRVIDYRTVEGLIPRVRCNDTLIFP